MVVSMESTEQQMQTTQAVSWQANTAQSTVSATTLNSTKFCQTLEKFCLADIEISQVWKQKKYRGGEFHSVNVSICRHK